MSMEEIETGTFANARVVSKVPDVIRVVSWNIARGCQLDGVAEFLLNNQADLIILQETDRNSRRTLYRNIAREISQKLGMNYVFGIEFQELSQGSYHSPAYHGQATLSPWPISDPHILRCEPSNQWGAESVAAIREFNESLKARDDLRVTFLPVGDGVALGVRLS